MGNYSHDCKSCSESCSFGRKPDTIKKVIGVVHGKGSVGKSMTTSMFSVLVRREEKQTAILDADITRPFIPKMSGLTKKAVVTERGILPIAAKTHVEGTAARHGLNVLGKIPMDARFSRLYDEGNLKAFSGTSLLEALCMVTGL